MSISIDRILSEARGEQVSLGTSNIAKVAATTTNHLFSDDEIVKMAGLLNTSSFGDSSYIEEERSFEEKVAEAMILAQSLQETPSEVSEESEKIAAFISKAQSAGYSTEEIENSLEKNAAKIGNRTKNILKGLAGAGAIGGTAVASHKAGDKKGSKRGFKKGFVLRDVIGKKRERKAYRTGRVHQFMMNRKRKELAAASRK